MSNKDATTLETATESASSTNTDGNNGKNDGIVTEESGVGKVTQKPVEGDATQKPVEGDATQKPVEANAATQKPVDDQTKTTKRAVSLNFTETIFYHI